MPVSSWPRIFVGPTAPATGVIAAQSFWQELSLAVGDLWSDTTANLVKRCTSISPVTFVSVEHNQSHDHSAVGDGTALAPVSVVPSSFLTAPNGAGGPTIDAVGKLGVDSTSRTLNFHDGTAEVVLNPVKQLSLIIESPVAGDDLAVTRIRSACTLIETDYLCVGGTNWVGQVQEADANGLNPANTQAVDTTAAAGTNGQVTSYSNADIDAGDYLFLKTTSISGTPTWLLVTVYFREDA